jgi:hypothetical protein
MNKMKAVSPDGVKEARLVALIETKAKRGAGVNGDDPVREVTQYWSLTGRLICEKDPSQDA